MEKLELMNRYSFLVNEFNHQKVFISDIHSFDFEYFQNILNEMKYIQSKIKQIDGSTIKFGDFTVDLKLPDNFTHVNNLRLDDSVYEMLNQWCKMVDESKQHIDEWTTIPALPQYSFKNLKHIPDPYSTNVGSDVTYKWIYDDFKFNDI